MRFTKYNSSKEDTKAVSTYFKGVSSSLSDKDNIQATSIGEHKLWGLPFDGTQDVSGDINNAGLINATGDITTDGDIVINQLDENENIVDNGLLRISVDGDNANFTGKKQYNFDGKLNIDGDSTFNENSTFKGNVNVSGTTTVNEFTANKDANFKLNIEVDGTATINKIVSKNIDNADTIKTKNLEVTGKAHFFELVIDKLKSVGGQIILTAANAVIDYVNGNKLYFRCKDADGKQITNDFEVNDQVICLTFNAAVGTSYNTSNKYYWTLVTAIGDEKVNINGLTVDCHYIQVDTSKVDGKYEPAIGDNIVQLGYRGNDDVPRQSAIILAAYKTPDSDITPPSIAFYRGIKTFELKKYRYTYSDANKSRFIGEFVVDNGKTVEELIKESLYRKDVINSITIGKSYNVSFKVYEQKEQLTSLGNYSLRLLKNGNPVNATINNNNGTFSFNASGLSLLEGDTLTIQLRLVTDILTSANVSIVQASDDYKEIIFDRLILSVFMDSNNLNGYLYANFICYVLRNYLNNTTKVNPSKVKFDFCSQDGTVISTATKSSDGNGNITYSATIQNNY